MNDMLQIIFQMLMFCFFSFTSKLLSSYKIPVTKFSGDTNSSGHTHTLLQNRFSWHQGTVHIIYHKYPGMVQAINICLITDFEY